MNGSCLNFVRCEWIHPELVCRWESGAVLLVTLLSLLAFAQVPEKAILDHSLGQHVHRYRPHAEQDGL